MRRRRVTAYDCLGTSEMKGPIPGCSRLIRERDVEVATLASPAQLSG